METKSNEKLTLDNSLLVQFEAPAQMGTGTLESLKARGQRQDNFCGDAFTHTDATQEILNATVPPRVWEMDGKIWKQTLSRSHGTRLDAINLQHELDRLLKEHQAFNHGLCPVRRQLFSHCLDEVIRQVTMYNPDRGLLLLRLRDEVQMTLGAYHTLYESAVTHGRQSADAGYVTKMQLLDHIEDLESGLESSREEVKSLQMEVDHTRRRLKERREMDGKRFAEEVQFLKRANQQLKQETESLLDYGRKSSSTHIM